jgi:hypothetical protein
MTAGSTAWVEPKHACALGMGSVDSAFLIQTLKVDITSYTHPDYAALVLFLQYLQQLEVRDDLIGMILPRRIT